MAADRGDTTFGQPYPWAFADGRFVPSEQAGVGVLSNVLSYGTGTFEGEVEGRPVGDGRPGRVTLALQQAFGSIARGDHPAYEAWTTPVYQPKETS